MTPLVDETDPGPIVLTLFASQANNIHEYISLVKSKLAGPLLANLNILALTFLWSLV